MADRDNTRATIVCEGLPRTRAEALAVGARHYFTGKPCKHGHVEKRVATTTRCVGCLRDKSREFRGNNPEYMAAAKKRHREKYPERAKAQWASWWERNLEYKREQSREWHKKNPDRSKENSHRDYRENGEARRAKSRAWKAENKGRVREYREENRDAFLAYGQNRRARVAGVEGSHTRADIERIRELQKDKCACCNTRLRGAGTIDHIIPVSKGGSNWPRNLQLLCKSCNSSKNARDPVEFMQAHGKLL